MFLKQSPKKHNVNIYRTQESDDEKYIEVLYIPNGYFRMMDKHDYDFYL